MTTSSTSASLIIKVDATQANQGAESLDKLSASAGNAEKSVDSLAESNE